MSESVQPIPPETEETLCLYLLDLLANEERAAVEAQLAAEPHLRRSMRDLQGSLEGWVESLPQRPAPLRAWGRIAATIRSAEAPVFATRSTAVERRGWAWGWQAFGAAACLLAGMGLQAWWGRGPAAPVGTMRIADSPGSSRPPGGRGVAADPAAVAGSQGMSSGAGGDSRESTTSNSIPVDFSHGGQGPSRALVSRETPREKVLQSQVSVLTELLNRELGTLPGASKLQVVRLVGPGESADVQTLPALDSNMLAALALSLLNQQQIAPTSLGSVPGGTGKATGVASSTATVPAASGNALASASSAIGSRPDAVTSLRSADSLVSGSVQVASPTGSAASESSTVTQATEGSKLLAVTLMPAGNGTGTTVRPWDNTLGGFTPDKMATIPAPSPAVSDAPTGPSGLLLIMAQESAGTAVISNPNPLTGSEVYQFWQIDPATGATVSLGTAHSDASPAIFNFNLPAGRSANASVFITREPAGGSKVPTGPIVVSTPTPKP